MTILLDTHASLWAIGQPENLSLPVSPSFYGEHLQRLHASLLAVKARHTFELMRLPLNCPDRSTHPPDARCPRGPVPGFDPLGTGLSLRRTTSARSWPLPPAAIAWPQYCSRKDF